MGDTSDESDEPTRSFRPMCAEHGELDTFEGRGYALGHRTRRGEPNERDLEGVTFTFGRAGDDSDAFQVSAAGSERYLSKFADWRETMLRVVNERADPDDLECPSCGRPVVVFDVDEETPEWFKEYMEEDDPPR